VTLILWRGNVASMRALRPCRFPFGLRLHNLSPDDGQKLVGNHPLAHHSKGSQVFQGEMEPCWLLQPPLKKR
jgi:hypothetical protein